MQRLWNISLHIATSLECITANFNNVAKITVDSESITPEKKRNGVEEDIQEDHRGAT